MNELQQRLTAHLASQLGRQTAIELVEDLSRTAAEPDRISGTLVLLQELEEVSAKVAVLAREALPDLQQRQMLDVVTPWLDLGVALAESSGAAAMRYFKESPLLMGLIPAVGRQEMLRHALELADHDANLALEFIRAAPELVAVVPLADVSRWLEVGLEVGRVDYVLGVEFFRQSAAAARVVGIQDVRAWVAFAVKLITQNTLGKTDYLPTLEFFRTSPAILGDIQSLAVRKGVIDLGSALAERDPGSGIACLAESPSLLRRIPVEGHQLRVLQYGIFLVEHDSEAALAYLRRCPEMLEWIGDGPDVWVKFDEWYRAGMEVLALSAEGGRAYFSLETRKAVASMEQAASGVPLRQVARALKLFVEALCGTDIAIAALPEASPAAGSKPPKPTVSRDGRLISLPAVLRYYPSREANARLYTLMAAHEAGHLEFGTYRITFAGLVDLVADVCARYRQEAPSPDAAVLPTLEALFRLYPQPELIRDLWTVLEDARVEHRLQQEYPGLAQDLSAFAREAMRTRSLSHGMTVREMLVDALLLWTTAGPDAGTLPEALRDLVQETWGITQSVLDPQATPEDVIRAAHAIYVLLDARIGEGRIAEPPPSHEVPSSADGGPKASETGTDSYRPVTNWIYRGEMAPELVVDRETGDEGHAATDAHPAAGPARQGTGEDAGHRASDRAEAGAPGGTARVASEPGETESVDRAPVRLPSVRGDDTFYYDEWDGIIQDYRSGWCRLVERTAPGSDSEFAETTLAAHAGIVRLLRRYFESLRPSGLRRVFGQLDGEDLDLDATIRRMVDRRAGAEGSDRIYLHRDKRQRQVAVAFLVDLSGSTGRQIEGGRRVIDVEKEALVLLCEALEAIGDQYAIYGYSGQGRRQIDFVVLKDFDEPVVRSSARIGAMVPLQQNRDGVVIRHAGRKLLARDAKARLLVLIGDGRPLDDAYADEYALEDTKKALQELGRQGIHAFCITVDRQADDYLRRMYGDVRYLVMDHVAALPERLPRLYQRLTA